LSSPPKNSGSPGILSWRLPDGNALFPNSRDIYRGVFKIEVKIAEFAQKFANRVSKTGEKQGLPQRRVLKQRLSYGREIDL
jgi:hypothetical protein